MHEEDVNLDYMNPCDEEKGIEPGGLLSHKVFEDDLELDSDLDNLPI